MPNQAFSAAATPEMRELSTSRQTWYVGQDAASLRMYWVYTPASYQAGTAVPLVMILHGCAQPFYSHPWAIAYDTHMNQLAEAHQFLVVYPHHFAPPDINPISCWNFFLPENNAVTRENRPAWPGLSRKCSRTPPGGRLTQSGSMWPASPRAGARPPTWEPPTPISSPPSGCTQEVSTATPCRLSVSRRQHGMPWRP